MEGPQILTNFLQEPTKKPDKHGNKWQYHSRSDRHSKVGCWGVALDLLVASSLLRRHVKEGKVVLGINHTMTDYATSRKKDLDLVIARPATPAGAKASTFASLVDRYGIQLTGSQQDILNTLPDFPIGDVGAVLVALEAKACMTAHVKARPRLYDELNSSHLCVHGASRQALAIGYVQINNATRFVSPIKNGHSLETTPVEWTDHCQPADTERVLEKIAEIPRRSNSSENGFDGIGVTVLDFENNGGPVALVEGPPAPKQGDPFHYDGMIVRMANEYDTTFASI